MRLFPINECTPFVVVAAAALSTLPTAFAWGAAGHEIVATIAQIHLQPPVLSLLCDILYPASDISSDGLSSASPPCYLASIAAWADRIRSQPAYRYTAPLHYINALDDAPPDTCPFPGSRGWAGRPTGNVLAAVQNVTGVLRDFARGERGVGAAEEALKFLVHWVGDMHMPLHLSGREKGGNGVRVLFDGRVTNLHSVWDSLLIAQALRTIPSNYTHPLHGDAAVTVEPHLRGAIYDPYVRRIMHEGFSPSGRFADSSDGWLTCPQPESEPEISMLERAQALFGIGAHATSGRQWDDAVLCPYAWARPIHELNCAFPLWPHELDQGHDFSLAGAQGPTRICSSLIRLHMRDVCVRDGLWSVYLRWRGAARGSAERGV
ncbi:Nuclease S1 [Grifola frondosa]|uniref:Nuclease S1 n=1 Tax=Grifola frondosa TaxID=5627 RepID=A0A1C7MRE6_GRIFR|nr:Nuclease S1 [Grifola frondosa]